jgi:nitrogen regulatory protein P-II 1
MKEVHAYVHRDRVADVIAALKDSSVWGGAGGDERHNLAVYLVRSVVPSASGEDRRYSSELGDEIVNEYKLELICPEGEVEELVRAIAEAARTGSAQGGWITVAALDLAQRIA